MRLNYVLVSAVTAAAMLLVPAAARAATITVNSTADTSANDGVCTLREAITAANTNTASGAAAGECAAGAAGLDTIAFAIPGAGLQT
ncbi:MAG: CSLREA domain-containing protein, partial [Acidobacteriota bacterium]|nr:CSLREA domain-containing protein [Acidobacteriota bacterium]